MTDIARIQAREVLDSRGRPTVEVDVHTQSGHMGRAIVPSGASTGTAEALELRDDHATRYDGLGVQSAVDNVNQHIAPQLVGRDVRQQSSIDETMLMLDDTPRKEKLGANAILGVSLATARAAATCTRVPLFLYIQQLYQTDAPEGPSPPLPCMPMPMTNMISGGLHAGGKLDIQDVLVLPVGATDYRQSLEWIVRVYRRLGHVLKAAGYESDLVGDEGGYGPALGSNQEALELVTQAIEAADLSLGAEMSIALDIAATQFFDGQRYQLARDEKAITSEAMVEQLAQWSEQYPIVSIEDGLDEEDWSGWVRLTRRLGQSVQLVGDDLFATNPQRVRHGASCGAANSVLIKLNQIGTLTETLKTIHTARQAGMSIVVSARSGETEDATISDLAVGVAANQIKIGSVVRSERLAKYNQLLRIQEQLEAQPELGSVAWSPQARV